MLGDGSISALCYYVREKCTSCREKRLPFSALRAHVTMCEKHKIMVLQSNDYVMLQSNESGVTENDYALQNNRYGVTA
jgi:hypothetical protein